MVGGGGGEGLNKEGELISFLFLEKGEGGNRGFTVDLKKSMQV